MWEYYSTFSLNWPEEDFMNKNVNIISLWTYVIQHLKDKENVLWKRIAKDKSEFRIEKILKKKGHKYVKWKVNHWIGT